MQATLILSVTKLIVYVECSSKPGTRFQSATVSLLLFWLPDYFCTMWSVIWLSQQLFLRIELRYLLLLEKCMQKIVSEVVTCC